MQLSALITATFISLARTAAISVDSIVDSPGNCAASSFQVKDIAQNHDVFPFRTYVSSPLTPPNLIIDSTGRSLQPGLLFFGVLNSGALNASAEQGLFIMTDEGDLVFGVIGAKSNFQPQTLNGEPVFSYWEGTGAAEAGGQASIGYGKVEIFNHKYERLYTICPNLTITTKPDQPKPECIADVHESILTEDGTMMITVYNLTQTDLSGVGGPSEGWVFDPLAVEVDPVSNDVLFIWSPLAHVSLTDSHYPLAGTGINASQPYDYFHVNSVQKHNGGYLINSRHCWATYFVNKNGTIEWQINGQDGGDFGKLPAGGQFSWQHDARIWNDPQNSEGAILSYFANNNYLPNTNQSSIGLSFSFSYPPSLSSNIALYRNFTDMQKLLAAYAQGTNSFLSNGNSFLGYGALPFMREWNSDGELLWSAQFGFDSNTNSSSSYRAFKSEWHATPSATVPAFVVQVSNGTDMLSSCAGSSKMRGYVSWNGASDVTAWNVYLGNATDQMTMQYQISNMGFETVFSIPYQAQYAQVGAVQDGEEVRRSNVTAIIC